MSIYVGVDGVAKSIAVSGGGLVDISTTEQLTGRTFNGQPTYIKLYTGSALSNSAGSINVQLDTNIRYIVQYGGIYNGSVNTYAIPGYIGPSGYSYLVKNAGFFLLGPINIIIGTSSAGISIAYYVWVEYTR